MKKPSTLTCLAALAAFSFSSLVSAQTILTSNSDFENNSDFRNLYSANPDYSTTDRWEFPTNADRGSYVTTGGPSGVGDAYVGGSTDGTTNGLNALLQIIDVSGLGLDGTNALALSFDLLNNDAASSFTVNYELFFANTDANGAIGTAISVPTGRSPYAFKDDNTLTVTDGNITLAANSGWSNSGSILTGFDSISFPGTFTFDSGGSSSTTIANYADVDYLILRVGWTNLAATGGVSPIGVDNVELTLVPEPTSFALFATSGAFLLLMRRRRARQ